MVAYAVREDPRRGTRVAPHPVGPALFEIVTEVCRAPWPVWLEPSTKALRGLLELCRLQTARGLTVLSWLAAGAVPDDHDWLLASRRLAGDRQRRMYRAAATLDHPVRDLVVTNWAWAVASPHGGRVIAPYLASGAYETDGHAAAYAATMLGQTWSRHPEVRPSLAAAWAATRTSADWCKAAELRVTYGAETPVFTYPRSEVPDVEGIRPWITYLLLDGHR